MVIVFWGLSLNKKNTNIEIEQNPDQNPQQTENQQATDSNQTQNQDQKNYTSNNQNKNMNDTQKQFSFEVLKKGSGTEAKTGDNVLVAYKGMFTDGKIFDQGEFPFTLGAGQVIQGFDMGVTGMQIGETRKVYIPSDLGYGPTGSGNVIPPNTDLVFEITLSKIQ